MISGKPTIAGSFTAQLVQTDAYAWNHPVDIGLTIATELSVTRSSMRAAKTGSRYASRVKIEGGVAPYSWRVVRGALPTGLRLDPKTGLITGIARRTGSRRLTVRVTDHLGAFATSSFVLKVVR